MKIHIDSEIFTPEQITALEKEYSATYVCETCLRAGKQVTGEGGRKIVNKLDGEWLVQAFAIFFQSEGHPEGSQYMAVWRKGKGIVIADGISATSADIRGVITESGDVIYSRHRHDCRTEGEAMIDGGRDYFRTSVLDPARYVNLRIIRDKLVIVNG